MNGPSSPSLLIQYDQLIASGAIEADPAQADAVAALSALDARLDHYKPASKRALIGRFFADTEPPQGLYIHGDVGRGKTMLMDLFFRNSRVAHKRRAHFHEFMADVHDRIYGFRQKIAARSIPDSDPIHLTAASIFDDAWLLCFDEFHVTDIADAMILGRLFARLFELGTVIVATSNVAPDDLYKGGLNRALFLPFIAQIEKHMDVMKLEARTDFRMEKLAGVKMWLVPADKAADRALDDAWLKLTGSRDAPPRDVALKGRVLHIDHSAHGVARFTFEDLCEKPLGAPDYLTIARDYHTVMIDHVPVMRYEDRNPAKRFIALIDALYENHVKLMASAEAELPDLYIAEEGAEAFEFARTISRITEMGSESYLALPHGRRDSTASGASTGLVET
ncbi:MAG: cell division protein ZapE [Bradyrhizobiaceae bacterium]|nr:MAG: cell division protein ZapE [Bradyrhizobiaceae bacterium]